jgi:hypothetical protein
MDNNLSTINIKQAEIERLELFAKFLMNCKSIKLNFDGLGNTCQLMKTVQEKNDEKTIVWQLEEVSMDDDFGKTIHGFIADLKTKMYIKSNELNGEIIQLQNLPKPKSL